MSPGATGGVAARRSPRLAASASFFVNGALLANWVPNIPLVKDQLRLDPAALGLALAAVSLGALVSMTAAGYLVTRFGSARLITVAAIVYCLVLPGTLLAPDGLVLTVVLLTIGAASGAMDVSMNAQAVHIETLRQAPLMSSFHGSWSLGALVGAAVVSLTKGWGVAPLHVVVGAAIVLGIVQLVASLALERGDRLDDRPVLLVRPPGRLVGLGAVAFCALLAEGAVGDWSALYLQSNLGASLAVAPLGFAALSLAMTLSRFAGDRVVAFAGAPRIVCVGGALVVAGLVAALLPGSVPIAIAGFFLMGLGLANAVPQVLSAAGTVRGVLPSTGIAAAATLGYLGLLSGPPAIGFAAQGIGLPGALWIVVACGLLVAVAGPLALRGASQATRGGAVTGEARVGATDR